MKVRVPVCRVSQSGHPAVSCTQDNLFKFKGFRLNALLLTAALNLLALLLLAGISAAQCAPNPASPSVTICSPANGATVTSPVSLVAGTTDTAHPVTAMKVYLDNVVVYTAKANQLSTSLSISSGQHHITVNAWDSSGAVFKSSSLTLTVSSTAPAPVSVAVSPIIANVAPGQTQQFTATVTNATNTAVIWQVDGVTGGNAGVGTISASGLYTGGTLTGTHNVVAISQADTTKGATAIVTLTAPTTINACTAASAPPSVTICNPVSGSTVYGPVTFAAVAASNSPVTKFLLYLDYVLVDQSNTASIDAGLTVATGTHHLTAQFYIGTAWVKQSETFTVSSAPAVRVSASLRAQRACCRAARSSSRRRSRTRLTPA
jgi:hypothetical protein